MNTRKRKTRLTRKRTKILVYTYGPRISSKNVSKFTGVFIPFRMVVSREFDGNAAPRAAWIRGKVTESKGGDAGPDPTLA